MSGLDYTHSTTFQKNCYMFTDRLFWLKILRLNSAQLHLSAPTDEPLQNIDICGPAPLEPVPKTALC